ncbi:MULTISPECIES: hypothetical protein [Bradyrhizobium]|uniref:hypothetical protein n=1 Tax=Bradyrhizobium TaxID=374 RepID=UPI0035D45248
MTIDSVSRGNHLDPIERVPQRTTLLRSIERVTGSLSRYGSNQQQFVPSSLSSVRSRNLVSVKARLVQQRSEWGLHIRHLHRSGIPAMRLDPERGFDRNTFNLTRHEAISRLMVTGIAGGHGWGVESPSLAGL